MIKIASIVPHSPILIPSIGKQNTGVLKKTVEAINTLKKKIAKEKIDTIIIISPHQKENTDISLNNHFNFNINFREFGDYSSRIFLTGDLALAYHLKESAEPEFQVALKAKSTPDHGSNIPLYLLLSENNQIIKDFKGKVIIINTSKSQDLKYHYDFGEKISFRLKNSSKNIAVIASGELSHCLSPNAPGGFFHKANFFDDKTIEHLKKGESGVNDLLATNVKLATEAKECGLRPIAVLLGIISSLDYKPSTLSYQKDLGIGYLTMDMNL